jgi:hypothetical protein
MSRNVPDDPPPEMAKLPESWRTFLDGTPVPNWVAAIQDARDSDCRAIDGGSAPEMAPLPDGWGEMASGDVMPDVAKAVRRSRASH